MKLLLDVHLSYRLSRQLVKHFPGTSHLNVQGLSRADDLEIWQFAKEKEFVILTKDWDFHQLASLHGQPPKVIFLALPNCSSERIRLLVESKQKLIEAFGSDEHAVLVLKED